jgi:hypothetical protein
MNPPDALDTALLIIAGLAGVAGWQTSGAIRLGHLAGFLIGAVLGLVVAEIVTPVTAGIGLRLLVAIGLLLLGGALLGGLGGRVGLAVGQGLRHLHLQVADRLLGALLSGATILLICWVLLNVATVLWPDSGLAIATGGSRLVGTFDSAVPNLTHRIAAPATP